MDDALNTLIPADEAEAYDVRDILGLVVDRDSLLELHASYAPNVVTAFASLDGYSVGIVANQPSVMAGVLDIDASDKIARFIRICDVYNVPVVTFVDCPGFLPGLEQEHGGVIRHGAKLLYAYCEATVPKITIILRRAARTWRCPRARCGPTSPLPGRRPDRGDGRDAAVRSCTGARSGRPDLAAEAEYVANARRSSIHTGPLMWARSTRSPSPRRGTPGPIAGAAAHEGPAEPPRDGLFPA
jgi:hypothetical protein